MVGAQSPAAPPARKLKPLFEKTLGLGAASAEPLLSPSPDRAWFVWQGELEGPGEITRIRLPIPLSWLERAGRPHARLVWAWDSPVNKATDAWTCRGVKCELRASLDPESRALVGDKRSAGAATAWRDRSYSLALGAKLSPSRDENGQKIEKALEAWPEDGLWMLSLWYEETAALPVNPRVTYSTRQRVGLAFELSDAEPEGGESPQGHVQGHWLSVELDRLSNPLQTPNTVRVPNRPG